MPKLSDNEIAEFLGERGHLARIATVRTDGSPSLVPVWFIFEGGKVLITPRKHSAFLANLQREPRVAITIDEDQGGYRKVLLEKRKCSIRWARTASGMTFTGGSRVVISMTPRPITISPKPRISLALSLASIARRPR
jgi:hypothetical protein